MTDFQIKQNDIATMLESLRELFQEKGDKVRPIDLAERMTQKLGRDIHYRYASYLMNQMGFMTTVQWLGRAEKRYIVRDEELLEKARQ